MTNSELLKQAIRNRGIKLGWVADTLGITRQALSDKISNRTEFKASEINTLLTILDLTMQEGKDIFFAEKVGK